MTSRLWYCLHKLLYTKAVKMTKQHHKAKGAVTQANLSCDLQCNIDECKMRQIDLIML